MRSRGSGSLVNYGLASLAGFRTLWKWGRRTGLSKQRARRSIGWIRRHGAWAIAFSYFVPGVRMAASYVAGLLRVPVARYSAASLGGVTGWVGVYFWVGWALA